jgi:hypothetical protein
VLSQTRFILTMLSFLVATNLLLSIKQTAPYTTAASWGEYGERGFDETLDYLRANLNGSVPIIRKDLGYYLTISQPNREFTWIYNSIFRGNLKDPVRITELQDTISRDDVRYVVLDRYSNRKEASKLIGVSFSQVHKFGDFDVYLKYSQSRIGNLESITMTR